MKRAGGFDATGPRERGVPIKLPGCCAARKARHLSMGLTFATSSSPVADLKVALLPRAGSPTFLFFLKKRWQNTRP
jgi:hypothetical protein